jgi:hypothetical protein
MELVAKISLLDALYHAAARYEKDEYFRRGVEQPEYVAHCLRESAERIERMHDERRLP